MATSNKTQLPIELANSIRATRWLEPWECVCFDAPDIGQAFAQELTKELHNTHSLYAHRKNALTIATQGGCDDVLFWLPNADQEFAVVHLT